MSLKDDIPRLLQHVKHHHHILNHNSMIFSILEGELLPFIVQDLKLQLSPRSFQQIQHRIPPINIFIKLIDKLSKIYATGPNRELIKDNPNDQELMDFYTGNMQANQSMNDANENFNAYKNTWIEPFVFEGKPGIRSIPADRFLPYSNNPEHPTEPTHLIKFMGAFHKGADGHHPQSHNIPHHHGHGHSHGHGHHGHGHRGVHLVTKMHIFDKDEFLIIDSDGDIHRDEMTQMKNPDGVNSFGTLPGVYINRSKNLLIPLPDSDTLKMTKLIPVLLSDLNYAVMFQAFSIIWGIDVNDENLKQAPNAFWRFKTDTGGASEKKPQIGVIKPQVDIDEVLNLIQSLIALWFQSKGIRPGSVGKLSRENFVSGISKMVDDMDTFEDRQKQVGFFIPAEHKLWNKTAFNFHPVWKKQKLIEIDKEFSKDFGINSKFTSQRPLFNRAEVLDEIDKERKLGILDRKRAAKRVNPGMTDKEIDQLLADVDAETQTVTLDGSAPEEDHAHSLPDGGQTGGLKDVGNNLHVHSIPGDGETQPAPTGKPHTHKLPDGRETGPSIPIGGTEDGV